MKVLGFISTTALFLLFGANVPAFAQEEHHDEGAKPAQHEEQAKPAAKREQAKPQRQEQQAKPQRTTGKAKNRTAEANPAQARARAKSHRTHSAATSEKPATATREPTSATGQDSAKRREKSDTNKKPMAMRNNHKVSTHEMVRKIGTDTNTTKVVLVLTIMPALRKTVGATTTDAGSTLTAAIGSMQEHIQRGFTSRTCTSLWERMGYGMQWRTITLL